jgi:predicted helicase
LENTAKIKRQNEKKISVIIGNPPYNVNQQNENDNNKNREYPVIDKRIKATYVKESKAQKTKVYDMYARFFRWATDRLNDNGIVAFITNLSFIDAKSFDGFRKVIKDEFDYIYLIDLGGNIRGGDTTGNVFNIMVGVAIVFLVKKTDKNKLPCQIFYYSLTNLNSGAEKLHFLAGHKFEQINFKHLQRDEQNNWINLTDNDFYSLLSLANKNNKLAKNKGEEKAVFKLYSLGLASNRDEWVYDFDKQNLANKVKFFCDFYQQEQIRWFFSQ